MFPVKVIINNTGDVPIETNILILSIDNVPFDLTDAINVEDGSKLVHTLILM